MEHHDKILFLRLPNICRVSFQNTLGAITALEGRRFQMSAIRIVKNHFLALKFACCTNNFKLCPFVGEKLLLKLNWQLCCHRCCQGS